MTTTSDIQGIIFDYGGTIDTGGDHWSYVIRDGWRHAGIAADTAVFREIYVEVERELARTRHILPHHNFLDLLRIKMQLELQLLCEKGLLPPEDIGPKADIAARYCYDVARSHVDAARPVIEQLAQTYKIALVSNFYGNIHAVLADFGLDRLFSKVVESAVVGIRKPDPEIFRLGCRELGLPPEKVVVVGDSFGKDIKPALAAGCRAVWIKGLQWDADAPLPCFKPAIDSLKELPAALQALSEGNATK